VRVRQADVVLVSQIVTHRDVHLANLAQLVVLLKAAGLREKVLLLAGGPQITPGEAQRLGFDAGFGAGTKPSEVADFIATELVSRR